MNNYRTDINFRTDNVSATSVPGLAGSSFTHTGIGPTTNVNNQIERAAPDCNQIEKVDPD